MNKIEASVGEDGLSSEHQEEILDDPGKVQKKKHDYILILHFHYDSMIVSMIVSGEKKRSWEDQQYKDFSVQGSLKSLW